MLRVWRSGVYEFWHMIQWSCEILLKRFWGKEIRTSKWGDTVNRGTVNRGFTVIGVYLTTIPSEELCFFCRKTFHLATPVHNSNNLKDRATSDPRKSIGACIRLHQKLVGWQLKLLSFNVADSCENQLLIWLVDSEKLYVILAWMCHESTKVKFWIFM
jgi:hypothetical protein